MKCLNICCIAVDEQDVWWSDSSWLTFCNHEFWGSHVCQDQDLLSRCQFSSYWLQVKIQKVQQILPSLHKIHQLLKWTNICCLAIDEQDVQVSDLFWLIFCKDEFWANKDGYSKFHCTDVICHHANCSWMIEISFFFRTVQLHKTLSDDSNLLCEIIHVRF